MVDYYRTCGFLLRNNTSTNDTELWFLAKNSHENERNKRSFQRNTNCDRYGDLIFGIGISSKK